jgi:hypothetical protein
MNQMKSPGPFPGLGMRRGCRSKIPQKPTFSETQMETDSDTLQGGSVTASSATRVNSFSRREGICGIPFRTPDNS